jgi:fused signal recognition particle receptor
MALQWFKRKKKVETAPQKDLKEPAAGDDLQAELEQPAQESPESTETAEESAAPGAERKGFLRGLRSRLAKTRRGFVGRLDQLLLRQKQIDEELLEELEEILITADIGVQTTLALIERVRDGVERRELANPAEIKKALQSEILTFLNVPTKPHLIHDVRPHVIMVVGVNGVGKTTTIGKLAARYTKQGKQVMLVAADTFRAAAVEQLEIWAERVGAEVIRHKGKSDPSAVVYDGIHAATSRDVDVVIIDTAGRLHTKVNLMEELKKVRRIVSRQLPGAPSEILLVLDATTGQNAIVQAQLFHEAIEITGIALAKLDGTAKGGIVVAICQSLGLPLQYIGLGEKAEDLYDFDADTFVRALF